MRIDLNGSGPWTIRGTRNVEEPGPMKFAPKSKCALVEPAYVQTILNGAERPIAPLYFRILIGNISGHRATKA